MGAVGQRLGAGSLGRQTQSARRRWPVSDKARSRVPPGRGGISRTGRMRPRRHTGHGQPGLGSWSASDSGSGCGGGAEDLADLCQALHPAAIAQQPVVAHPHQPLGQHVQQEAADEFRGVKGQRLVLAVAVIAVAQAHLIVVQALDARVAEEVKGAEIALICMFTMNYVALGGIIQIIPTLAPFIPIESDPVDSPASILLVHTFHLDTVTGY